jgi:hypothetical protein
MGVIAAPFGYYEFSIRYTSLIFRSSVLWWIMEIQRCRACDTAYLGCPKSPWSIWLIS